MSYEPLPLVYGKLAVGGKRGRS